MTKLVISAIIGFLTLINPLIYQTGNLEKTEAPSVIECATFELKELKEKSQYGDPNVWQSTGLTNEQIKDVRVEINENMGQPVVTIEFNEEGSTLLENITARNIKKPVGFFVNEELIAAPNVYEKITGGKTYIIGSFTEEEVQQLANSLNCK